MLDPYLRCAPRWHGEIRWQGIASFANGNDVVWNDGTPFDQNVPGGGGWASGGGISEIIRVPSHQAKTEPLFWNAYRPTSRAPRARFAGN